MVSAISGGSITYKEGYSDKEWETLHPMIKGKRFVSSRGDKSKKRSVKEVQIADMEVLKSAHTHDMARIASLKRKLDRATRKKYAERGLNYSDDEDIFGSDEDPSCITEASGTSGASGPSRNSLKKSTRKKLRFKSPVEDV